MCLYMCCYCECIFAGLLEINKPVSGIFAFKCAHYRASLNKNPVTVCFPRIIVESARQLLASSLALAAQ